MDVGMARHTQNVLKLANCQYLWTGLTYCIDFLVILYYLQLGVTRHIKITSCQNLLTESTYINFQQVVRLPWKLQIDHAILHWCGWACQKKFENIKFSIFLDLFPTVSVKVDHFNLSVVQSVNWLFFSTAGFYSCNACYLIDCQFQAF